MKHIAQEYHIHAPLEKVWKALITPKDINGWGGGPAKMDDQVGTKFSLWGGSVWGKNLEVIPQKKLVQEWYSEDEIKDAPSRVTFTLSKEKDGVLLKLSQIDIPDDALKNISEGWKDYYLLPLKEYCESK